MRWINWFLSTVNRISFPNILYHICLSLELVHIGFLLISRLFTRLEEHWFGLKYSWGGSITCSLFFLLCSVSMHSLLNCRWWNICPIIMRLGSMGLILLIAKSIPAHEVHLRSRFVSDWILLRNGGYLYGSRRYLLSWRRMLGGDPNYTLRSHRLC